MSLGLVELVIDGISHILTIRVAIRSYSPVLARLDFQPAQRIDGRLNNVVHGGRNANSVQLLQQFAIQLVAVVVVHLLVHARAEWRLIVDFFDPLCELSQCHGLAEIHVFALLSFDHVGLVSHMRQSGGGGGS